MDKKWVLSKLFLSIGGMQNAQKTSSSEKSSACCLLAVEKSANSEEVQNCCNLQQNLQQISTHVK
jgi:hypothetical protein